MKPPTHTRLWTKGVRQALAFGRYPALLVSLHAKTIYTTFFDFNKAAPDDARLIRSFLDTQEDFQRATVEALAADPRMAPDVTPDAIERNRRLVAATDRMSLEICWGITGEVAIPGVPTATGDVTELHIRSPHGDPADLTLSPGPSPPTVSRSSARAAGWKADLPTKRRSAMGCKKRSGSRSAPYSTRHDNIHTTIYIQAKSAAGEIRMYYKF